MRSGIAVGLLAMVGVFAPRAQAALVELGDVVAIAAGAHHVCALTKSGGAKCWGWNAHGQLGNGTTDMRLTPAGVSGLASGVKAISAGEGHSCALTTAGGVRCWGSNDYGQLGNGASTGSLTPVDVTGLSSGVAAISAGGNHTCALTTKGGVKCWGREGAVGNGTYSQSLVPADVLGLEGGAAAISAGGVHTCALTKTGGVKCWGLNTNGQLGDGTTVDRTTPVDVTTLASGVVAVASGTWHSCALTAAGGARCWGNNSYGQIGDGTQLVTRVLAPAGVAGLASGVASISGGYGHTCAVTTGGAAKCWGDNDVGQLGDDTTERRLAPVDVTWLSNGVAAIAAGEYHTCIVATVGRVQCWGSNDGGQLGDGGTIDRPGAGPVQIEAYPVTVSRAGTASGTVRSSPAGIDCGAACTIDVVAGEIVTLTATPAAGAYLAGWSGACTGTGPCSFTVDDARTVTATFSGQSLVAHYYRSILRREPDPAGQAFWDAEAARMTGLGANVNEVWYAMAQSFFASAEYLAFGRSNADFVTDLYTTFFNRPADAGGMAYWSGQLASGLPREAALVSFMFSAEFRSFTQAIFGTVTVRAEIDTVTDFYRGLLARLPDNAGFDYWLRRFRTAQCLGGAAVVAEAESISSLFATSAEYASRGRSNAQYVGDLYNAFLRRGGDLAGVQFWISELDTRMRTRENVRRAFVASPEFQGRVAAIISQGCM